MPAQQVQRASAISVASAAPEMECRLRRERRRRPSGGVSPCPRTVVFHYPFAELSVLLLVARLVGGLVLAAGEAVAGGRGEAEQRADDGRRLGRRRRRDR